MKNARHHQLLSFVCVLAAFTFSGCGHNAGSTKSKEVPRVTVAHPLVRELMDEDDYNGWLEALRDRGRPLAACAATSRRSTSRTAISLRRANCCLNSIPRPFQVEIDRETANARALEAQKIAAKKDVARYTELVKTGAASRQDSIKPRPTRTPMTPALRPCKSK